MQRFLAAPRQENREVLASHRQTSAHHHPDNAGLKQVQSWVRRFDYQRLDACAQRYPGDNRPSWSESAVPHLWPDEQPDRCRDRYPK